jgi:hypothetical protein
MTLSEFEYASKSDSELFQAIKTQKWPLVEKLLQEEPHLAKTEDEFGNVPLHSPKLVRFMERTTGYHFI